MIECPSEIELKRLLLGDSDSLSDVDTLKHTDECPECLTRLDKLSDDDELNRMREIYRRAESIELGGRRSFASRILRDARHASIGIPETRDAAETPPPEAIGPYQVERELGRGGMGVVYLARDTLLDRRVAIKVLRDAQPTPTAEAHFHREGRAAARVRHENVVSVHAVGRTDDGRAFLVMEYVEGLTLKDRIRRDGSLPPREAAALAFQAANGLAAAHLVGLIHRDVKPENILLRADEEDASPVALLTDFGLARAAEHSGGLTKEGNLVGTPAYMSPEQVLDPERIDGRTDIYSLGVVLREALTGEEPFRGKTAMILRQVAEDEPVRPRRLNDAIPLDLENICLKAMSKEPRDRYRTAGELARDLRDWLEGRPVSARPVGPMGRARSWIRRHPLPATLSVVLAATILGGSIAMFLLWRRAEANASRALNFAERSRLNAEEAKRNLERATGAIGKATQAVDRFYTRVSQESLFKQEGTAPLRKALLADAVTYYRELLKEYEHDRWIEGEIPVAARRLAILVLDTGTVEEALIAGEDALRLSEALLTRSPMNPSLRQGVAISRAILANISLRMGRSDDALAHVRKALPILRALAEEFPDEVDYRAELVGILGNLGTALYKSGGRDEARKVWLDLAEQLEFLTKIEPGVEAYRTQLATARNNLSFVTSGDEAIANLRKALALRAERAKGSAAFPVRDLARTEMNLARLLDAAGKEQEARELLDRAAARAETLRVANPGVIEFRTLVADVAQERAVFAARKGRLDEAEPLFANSIEVLEQVARDDPKNAAAKATLISNYKNLGALFRSTKRLDLAFETALKRRSAASGDASGLILAALDLARCLPPSDASSAAKPSRTRVVSETARTIDEARALGIKDPEALRKSEALAPILNDPEIQRVLP